MKRLVYVVILCAAGYLVGTGMIEVNTLAVKAIYETDRSTYERIRRVESGQ